MTYQRTDQLRRWLEQAGHTDLAAQRLFALDTHDVAVHIRELRSQHPELRGHCLLDRAVFRALTLHEAHRERMPPAVARQRQARYQWVWLLIAILLALSLFVIAVRGEETPQTPKPIAADKKVEILVEQIKVYRRLVEKLKAEVEMLRAEKDLGQMNQKLDQIEKDVRRETGADASWRVTEALDWEKITVPVVQMQEVKK